MNKALRQKLNLAIDEVEQMKAPLLALQKSARFAREIVEEVLACEQESFDNLPEGLRASERGEAVSSTIEALEALVSELSDITDSGDNLDLDDFIARLDEAKGGSA